MSWWDSRKSEDGDFDGSGVAEFAPGDRESLAHQNREQCEDERGEHEEDICANDAHFILDARLGVVVAYANGHRQRQQTNLYVLSVK